jgi:hypothetical protein
VVRRLRFIAAVLALALTSVVAACTGAPDRAEEAHALKSEIAAMPGVSSVSMRYENDIWQGTLLNLDVYAEHATEQQLEAVAAKINELRGNAFDEFDQTIKILVARWTWVSPGRSFDPAVVAQTAALTRQLRAEVQAQTIQWSGDIDSGASWLHISDATNPGDAVNAVLRALGPHPATIEVSPADRLSAPHWMVTGRLTVADKQRVDHILAALPGPASWVGVKDGRIVQLTFGIPSPATAYRDVVAAIRAVGAGPQHPVILTWSWRGDPAAWNEPRFAGSAEIGRCTPNTNKPTPTDRVTAEALELQQRIRDEFSACPK